MRQHYVLFDSQTSGIKLGKILREENIRAVVVLTPRELSSSCEISLLIAEESIKRIEELIKEHNVDVKGIFALERD